MKNTSKIYLDGFYLSIIFILCYDVTVIAHFWFSYCKAGLCDKDKVVTISDYLLSLSYKSLSCAKTADLLFKYSVLSVSYQYTNPLLLN